MSATAYPSQDGPIAPERILVDYIHQPQATGGLPVPVSQSAEVSFTARMAEEKRGIRSLKLIGWTMSGVPDLNGELPAAVGIGSEPWQPYYILELEKTNQNVDSTQAQKDRAEVSAQRLTGVPLILTNAGYNARVFESRHLQEMLRVDNPDGSLRQFKIRVSVPEDTVVPSVDQGTTTPAGAPIPMFKRLTLHFMAYPVTRMEGLHIGTKREGDPESVELNYYDSRRATVLQKLTDHVADALGI